MTNKLLLSIFPGLDLFGRAFAERGFCVVRGPDKALDGGCIRDFVPVPGAFGGIIGGSPCQDFSKLNRNPGFYGYEMLEEYQRVVLMARPDWWLLENVNGVPDIDIAGYHVQRFTLDLAWFGDYSRLRKFQFGTRLEKRVWLNPLVGVKSSQQLKGTAVVGNDNRSLPEILTIQGLPTDFRPEFLSRTGLRQAVGNAVPLTLGRYVASLIDAELYGGSQTLIESTTDKKYCGCGCGRGVLGRKLYASDACRKRASRANKKQHCDATR